MAEERPQVDELTIDLAAFAPQVTRFVRFRDTQYPVRAFLDLTVAEALTLLRAEAGQRWASYAERLAFARQQITILTPTMGLDVREQLTPRQVFHLAQVANEVSDAPRVATVRVGLMFAQAARFYGWAWQTIQQLTMRQLHRFLAFIPELQAQESLDASLVAAYPHMRMQDRQDLWNHWFAAARLAPPEDRTPRISWADVGRFIGRA